jgi:hypothetical protein
MKSLAEKTHAVELLDLLSARILSGNNEPILGYTEVAKMINWTKGANFGCAVGKVTSHLDYACFISGLPMLAVYYVRDANGEVNPRSFGGVWEPYRNEIVDTVSSYQWTQADFDKVRRTLINSNNDSCVILWNEVIKRGNEFIRYNLHRHINKEL